jgi:beta-lactamase regulating signal transducer with metallopeptidase domain
MLAALAALTLRGSLVFAFVWLLELACARRMRCRSRRAWWWLVGLAFVLPLQLPFLPPSPASIAVLRDQVSFVSPQRVAAQSAVAFVTSPESVSRTLPWLAAIWIGGVAGSLGLIAARTWRANRRWSSERLCTRPELLNLLEDCKADAGVTAPIGLIVTAHVGAPALLGWLRPRILLPSSLADELPPARLRAVFLHELAHFRACDLALHGLFSLACAIHWFNPLAHLAARRWLHYRELAADEAALAWLPLAERGGYGDALIAALKHAHLFPPPRGALALGESLAHLKHRIVMITRHSSLARHGLPALLVSCALSGLLLLQSLRAEPAAGSDPKAAAVAAMRSWLQEIDSARYAESWQHASELFKGKVPSAVWEKQLAQVRTPLGACATREVASASLQERLPSPDGGVKGPFVLVQFNSSFKNLTAARETVTFMKEADGQWRAAGYFVVPR